MPLPGDAGTEGQHAEQQSTVKHEDRAGGQYPTHRSLEEATRHQEPEVSEDDAARADVIGELGCKQPDAESSHEGDEKSDTPENSAPS